MGGADLHVQVGIANGVSHLLKGPSRSEHGKGAGKGLEARSGEACGHAHHIGLGNAAVKVAVGESLLENPGLGGIGQVGVQDHNVVMLLAQFHQGLAVAVPCGDLFYVCHLISPPIPP